MTNNNDTLWEFSLDFAVQQGNNAQMLSDAIERDSRRYDTTLTEDKEAWIK